MNYLNFIVLSYEKQNNICELFDQSSTIEDIVRERNEYQEQLDSSRAINTTDDNLTVTQFEEALALVEDEADRQAVDEFNREVSADLNEFNEDEINEEQLIEKQNRRMNKIETEFKTLDDQVLLSLIVLLYSNVSYFSFDQSNDMFYVVLKHAVLNIKQHQSLKILM